MAAPKGNQFWTLRSKHGRNKLFATPDLMWEAACDYFQWCVDNPLEVPLAGRGSTFGKATTEKKPRPFTMQGLCRYLGTNSAYFRTFKAQLPDDEEDFNTIIHAIEEAIYQQKFEMAVVGVFQHNLIARDLGLSDKTESKTDITTNGEKIESVSMADVLAAKKAKEKKE